MWWWRTRGMGFTSEEIGRGRVIFDNTPTASTPDGNI
jgi:hypothetical protein